MRFLSLFILIAFLSGHTAFAGDPFVIEIQIEQQIKRDEWVVKYSFPRPVKQVVFQRNLNLFRHESWSVETDNVELLVNRDHEELQSINGKRFTQVTIKLKSNYNSQPKDYEFFLPFTDGSQLVYTGHFNVNVPEFVQEDEHGNKIRELRYTFKSKDNHIYYLGNGYFEESKWLDPYGDGTYVYFGKIKPLQTDLFVGIIDPGLPTWLKDTLFEFMPKLFSEYKDKLGFPLTHRPMVFFNYKPDTEGTGSGGGTLPGVVQLRVEGESWQSETEALKERAVFLLAHEVAHIWNGELFEYEGEDNSFWLHEGGANAVAFRTSYSLGIFGIERLNEIFTDQLNQCIEGIGNNALNDSSKLRLFRMYYYCGSTIGLITEAAIRKKNADLTVLDFWSELFRTVSEPKRRYNQQVYFELLTSMAGTPDYSQLIKNFVESGVDSPKDFFFEILTAAGVPVYRAEESGQLVIEGYEL